MTQPAIPPTPPSYLPAPIPTPWDDLLADVATAAAWREKRPQVRQRFLDLLRDNAHPPAPADLQIETHEEIAADNFTIRYISYNVERDERAHAYLAIPNAPPPPEGFPAVLCIHGTTDWGARQTLGLPPDPASPDAKKPYAGGLHYARTLASSGFVTLSPEHFCCATRRPKTDRPFTTAEFYRRHPKWSAIGKSTFENHLAINVLQSLPSVDAQKIGVTGHSLGAQNTIFLAAYDERVRCATPNCAALTFWQNPEPLHWSRDHWYIYIPQLREAILAGKRPPTDFHEILSLVAPRPLLEIFALNDSDPAAQSQRVLLHLKLAQLYRLLKADPAHAFSIHGDGHSCPDLARAALLSWMKRWLKNDGARTVESTL